MTRKLTDHEGYEVDTDGNVYSKYRRLKPTVKRNGYLQVSLGRSKVAMVHRLVAEAFLPNPDNLPCINHKDNNKTNNKVSNLEWCTQATNIRHMTNQNRQAKGEDQGLSKLTEDDVVFIRTNHKIYDKKLGTRPLARRFNVDPAAILSVLRNKTWKHIT